MQVRLDHVFSTWDQNRSRGTARTSLSLWLGGSPIVTIGVDICRQICLKKLLMHWWRPAENVAIHVYLLFIYIICLNQNWVKFYGQFINWKCNFSQSETICEFDMVKIILGDFELPSLQYLSHSSWQWIVIGPGKENKWLYCLVSVGHSPMTLKTQVQVSARMLL